MLCSIYEDQVKTVWHDKFFNAQKQHLKAEDYENMVDKMNTIVDEALKNRENILVSSHIPGSLWEGTPWAPIYYDACARDYDHSAMFFGLLVCHVLINRPEKWYFVRQEKSAIDGKAIRGMEYFLAKK